MGMDKLIFSPGRLPAAGNIAGRDRALPKAGGSSRNFLVGALDLFYFCFDSGRCSPKDLSKPPKRDFLADQVFQ